VPGVRRRAAQGLQRGRRRLQGLGLLQERQPGKTGSSDATKTETKADTGSGDKAAATTSGGGGRQGELVHRLVVVECVVRTCTFGAGEQERLSRLWTARAVRPRRLDRP
jgi:hypothetical protein